jgi:beta-N-acetylhexosaminidase
MLLSAAPIAMLVSACLAFGHAPKSPRRGTPRALAVGGASNAPSGAATTARSLSLAQLAGQRVIYAYSGLRPPASLLGAIRAGEAAGVIFFGPNLSSAAQIRGVIDQLQRAALSSPLHAPLLMLADQEGGEVRRLPGPPVLSEKQIGASANAAALARSAGTGAGQNLARARINTNLAPVLDVYRRPGNFIDQFQRSYSSDSGKVSALGAAFISALQQTGVAATAKHFPGLGAASQAQNTDLRLVTLNIRLATLRAVDEAPYRAAIARGVKLVMTSWAIYPALDPRRPAGLSSIVIGRELRQRLGFRGVTITDAIDAAAITRFGNPARRSILAAAAGADLILCAATNPADNSPTVGLAAVQGLKSALADGQLSTSAARAAAARILALRTRVR